MDINNYHSLCVILMFCLGKTGVTEIYLGDLNFIAGHIAAHQLDNYSLAARYWLSCAEAEHAGCMNILASAYETGMSIVQADLDKSVSWHRRVVSTGTRWRCAGFYSALRLAILSATHIDTGVSTKHWLEKATELRSKLVSSTSQPDMCGADKEYIAYYLLDGHQEKWIDKLTSLEIDKSEVTNAGRQQWLDEFIRAKSLNDLMPTLIAMYDDYNRCAAAEEFALKMREDPDQLGIIEGYLTGLSFEECDNAIVTVNRLIKGHN